MFRNPAILALFPTFGVAFGQPTKRTRKNGVKRSQLRPGTVPPREPLTDKQITKHAQQQAQIALGRKQHAERQAQRHPTGYYGLLAAEALALAA
jgi:hypothetical protein